MKKETEPFHDNDLAVGFAGGDEVLDEVDELHVPLLQHAHVAVTIPHTEYQRTLLSAQYSEIGKKGWAKKKWIEKE